jgi:hypothetical protein
MVLHYTKKIFIVSGLFLFIFLFSTCNKNTTGPEPNNNTMLSILLQDETGQPLNGIEVSLSKIMVKKITNQYGYAHFENIPPGSYQVFVSRDDIPFFSTSINIKMGETKKLNYIITSKFNINIFIKNFKGKPVSGLEISTSPNTSIAYTDQNGQVILKNIPVRRYTFIVKRWNYNVYVYNMNLTFVDGKPQDLEIVIENQSPYVKILSPQDRNYQEITNINLVCEGYDFEDGNISEDSFTWYSNIDGKLGTGRNLSIDRMSLGKHIITIDTVDSDQNTSSNSIGLNLYYFERTSYFPIPLNCQWIYRYNEPIFTTIGNDGESEKWRLSDLAITMNDIDSRSSVISYVIDTKQEKKLCRYNVIDYFETDDINIYVSKTVEQLILSNENYMPLERMDIETVYHPRLLLIKNHIEPSAFSSYESTVSAEVTWYYRNASYGCKTYKEFIDVITTIDIGGFEQVNALTDIYNALTFTISQGETIRKWWLVKGIGIARLEYNTFDTPQEAVLKETNILTMAQKEHASKRAVFAPRSTQAVFSKELKTQSKTPERMFELRQLLRTFCP